MNLKEQLEEIYKNNFVGEMLSKIDLVMITEEYLEYEEGKVWLTEGGIELSTRDKTVSFTYDNETYQFISAEADLLSFVSQYDYYSIDVEGKEWAKIIEEKIADLKINWIKLVETDYNGSIQSEEEFPVDFIFTFDNGATLQIASVDMRINPDTHEFSRLNYALEGQILIAFNRIFDIVTI